MLLSYCANAIVLILARLVHAPSHDLAASDLDLILPSLQLSNSLTDARRTEETKWMRELCNEIAGRAQIARHIHNLPHMAQKLDARWPEKIANPQLSSILESQPNTHITQNGESEQDSGIPVRYTCSTGLHCL
jgi:hypothetical protein